MGEVLIKIIMLIILLILAIASCLSLKPSINGGVISSPIPAADINLIDHNGQPFQLNRDRGKVTLVLFGFSNCINECPATMAIIRQAFQTIGEASKDVVVIMVSTDPARDTP